MEIKELFSRDWARVSGFLAIACLKREFRFRTRVPGSHPISTHILGLPFVFGRTFCIKAILGSQPGMHGFICYY